MDDETQPPLSCKLQYGWRMCLLTNNAGLPLFDCQTLSNIDSGHVWGIGPARWAAQFD